MSFQGCEIYDKEWPELVGRTFDEVWAHTLSDSVHSTTRFVLSHAVANAMYRYCTVDSLGRVTGNRYAAVHFHSDSL